MECVEQNNRVDDYFPSSVANVIVASIRFFATEDLHISTLFFTTYTRHIHRYIYRTHDSQIDKTCATGFPVLMVFHYIIIQSLIKIDCYGKKSKS
jgi:hypothetical protein